MEAVVKAEGADRRRQRRRYTAEEHGVVSVLVRPGNKAMLIDISMAGARIDTEHRLLPGTAVDLLLERGTCRAQIRGRVLRCAVVRVCAASLGYRGAIRFEKPLPWFAEEERAAVAAPQVV